MSAVERGLGREPGFLYPASSGTQLQPGDDGVLVPPPAFADPEKTLTPAVRRLVGKFDPAERDARNRELGKAGERFVVDFERDRLRRAGREDLANQAEATKGTAASGTKTEPKTDELDARNLEVIARLQSEIRVLKIILQSERKARADDTTRHLETLEALQSEIETYRTTPRGRS